MPTDIIFFPNGMVAVFDRAGKQLAKYQVGRHLDSIRALERDGYDWRKLNVSGSPLQPEQFVDRLGRPMREQLGEEYWQEYAHPEPANA